MGISIRTFITVPFVVLTLLPAGLVGTLAYRNSQAAVEELAETLMGQVSDRVRQQLRTYLATSHFINQSTARSIAAGTLDPNQPRSLEQHFLQQFEAAFASSPIATDPSLSPVLPLSGTPDPAAAPDFASTPAAPPVPARSPVQSGPQHHAWSRSLNHLYLGAATGTFSGVEYRPVVLEDRAGAWTLAVSRADASTQNFLRQYAVNAPGQIATTPLDPPPPQPYDPRQRLWYQTGLKLAERNLAQGTDVGGWSPPYCDESTGTPVITAIQPVIRQGEVLGVLGGDFLFSDVRDFLREVLAQLKMGEGAIGEEGRIFVVAQDGTLLASSQQVEGTCDPSQAGALALTQAATVEDPMIRELVSLPVQETTDSPGLYPLYRRGDWFWTRWEFKESYGLQGQVYIVIPRSYFMATIDRGNQITLMLCVLAVALSLGSSLAMAARIIRPVEQLEQATQRLVTTVNQGGEPQTLLLDKNPFELYHLGQTFESMSVQLRDTFIAFSHFVPSNFLDLLGYRQPSEVSIGDSKSLAMTVLFSDIRSFTKLSETLTAAETFQFINDYLSHMEPAISQNKGFIDKYIGDAIMALFEGENNPDRAVSAGLAMLEKLGAYNGDRAQSQLDPIKIGIGIHTGQIILGTVGGENRWDTTVMGSDVNRASRVEGLTKEFKVSLMITQATLDQLQHSYAHRHLGSAKVRGVEEAVDIYEVYAGDPPALVAYKTATLAQFEAGVRAYQQQDYRAAREQFDRVLAQLPIGGDFEDGPAQFYCDRCQEHLSGDLGEWARSLDAIT